MTDTLMGKGAFDGNDEYYVGMLGMHGTKTANLSVSECDALVVCRFEIFGQSCC